MVGDDQRDAVIVVQRATQRTEGGFLAQQCCRGSLAQGHDQLGLYERDLAFEIRQALRDLVGFRVTVIWRAAFNDIGDINILAAFEFDRRQHAIQQLARLSHERLTLRVLVRARPFTDEQPAGFLVAHPEHRLRASGAQPAGSTVAHNLLELWPIEVRDLLPPVGGGAYVGWVERSDTHCRLLGIGFASTQPTCCIWNNRLNRCRLTAPFPQRIQIQLTQDCFMSVHLTHPSTRMPSPAHPRNRSHSDNNLAARRSRRNRYCDTRQARRHRKSAPRETRGAYFLRVRSPVFRATLHVPILCAVAPPPRLCSAAPPLPARASAPHSRVSRRPVPGARP